MQMLAMFDFNCKFLYAIVRNTARIGDSLVFNTSNLKREIEAGTIVFDANTRILVDSAFFNMPYFIKSTVRIGSLSARTNIEHCFGQFKSQFRLFARRLLLLIWI